MAKLLGLDIGTTGTKAIVIDQTGTVLAEHSAPYEMAIPRPGWAEQDPVDWVKAVGRCLEATGRDYDAIGLTGQMHGSVFLDADAKVIRPALLWCDQRTTAECAEIDAAFPVRQTTCNPPMTGFQLPKLLWLRKSEPESFKRVESVLLPKDFVRFVLSGSRVSEPSDASGTGCFDVPGRRWSEELLSAVGISAMLLPEVAESAVASSSTNGTMGLHPGIPIAGGAGDQAAAAISTGAIEPGVTSLCLGTSGVVYSTIPSPRPDPNETLNVFCDALGGWHSMGVMLNCGGSVSWARNLLFGDGGFSAFDEAAAAVPAGCDGLRFLPFISGERCPLNSPEARGEFTGISAVHGSGHFTRAVLEGTAFALAAALEQMGQFGARPEEIRVTGGGARSRIWLEILASVFKVPLRVVSGESGPAMGAAMLAGLANGTFMSASEAVGTCVRLSEAQIQPIWDYSGPYAEFKRKLTSMA